MFIAPQISSHLQGFAHELLRFAKFTLPADHLSQVVERDGHFAMFVAKEPFVYRQCLAVEGLGVCEFVFVLKYRGEVVEPYCQIRRAWAGKLLSHGHSLATKRFSFGQLALEHKRNGQVVEGLSKVPMPIGMKLSLEGN